MSIFFTLLYYLIFFFHQIKFNSQKKKYPSIAHRSVHWSYIAVITSLNTVLSLIGGSHLRIMGSVVLQRQFNDKMLCYMTLKIRNIFHKLRGSFFLSVKISFSMEILTSAT